MGRRRLAVTVMAASAATLAVVLSMGLAVALVWPEQREPRTQLRREAWAEPTTSVPADPGDQYPADHPAPTKAEETFAIELMLAHPALGDRIRDAYAEAAGRPLSSASELRVHSLVFRRRGCQFHRCLQLFIWLPGGGMVDFGRIIVDLSTEDVRVLRW